MPDLDKLYEKADKYLQRQKLEAAIETYQEILRYEPDDEESLVNLGDLNAKLNRNAEAVRYQGQLADHYIKRGDFAKAVATCRRVLKQTPQDVLTLMKLATLLEKSQKNSEALEVYREALGLYRAARLNAEMIDCLNHIVKLDANNLSEHVELAELTARTRQAKAAMPVLLRAAQLARRAGDESCWEKLVDQAHALDPNDETATTVATELYLKRGNFHEASKLVEPLRAKKPEDSEVLELACRAYLGAGNYPLAQPLCWKLYNAKPERLDLLLNLMEGRLRSGAVDAALDVAKQLKDRLFQQGRRNDYLQMIEKVYAADESNLEVLEILSGLYSDLNKEDALRRSLSHLFSLYLAIENYRKAADTLERILDVDLYGEGNNDRLINLEGHIDPIWYKTIRARMELVPASRTSPAPSVPAKEQPESLEDLLIEAEMYQQYQLAAKLVETLGKIDRLYPGAEEKDPKLRELYEAAGYTPKFKAPVAPATSAPPRAEAPTAGAGTFQALDDLRRIPVITANIYRESTPQGVLQVAVNEIGRALNTSRCWGAVGLPDRPPVLTAEYSSPIATPSDAAAAMRLFAFLMGHTTSKLEGWAMEDVSQAVWLSPVAGEIQRLGICSLQVIPLVDKETAAGLLLLEQCDMPRAWSGEESLLLRTIAAQVVIAVNNTKLRRLVRSLAGADPETGLLPRSAYLECLLAEARRCKDQSQPISVCLLEPVNPQGMIKSLGDAGLQSFVQQVGKAITPSLRQNDVSIRYSPLSIVVVFPDTALAQAGLAVEKMRRALAQLRVNGAAISDFCAAVCDVPLGPNFDAVDGVTEVINRLEVSLDRAHKEGGKRILISKFSA